jgi:predicted RNase H-like nuclease (RuvC/YqgF family)
MDYLKTQAESYERKLKEKEKEIKELKKHNEWLKNKVNELSDIDELVKLQNKYAKCKKVAMSMFTESQKAFFEKSLND